MLWLRDETAPFRELHRQNCQFAMGVPGCSGRIRTWRKMALE